MNPVEKFLAEYSFVKTADPFSAAIPATLGGAALGAIDTYRRDDNDNKARDIIRSAMVTGGGAVAGSGLGRIVGTSIGRRTGNEALGGNAGENIGALAGALTGQQLAQYANRMNLSMLNGRPEKKKEKGKEAGAMVRVPSAGSARSAAGAVGDAVGDAAGAVGDSSGWAAPGGAANRVARKAIDPAKGFFARAKQIYNGDRIEDLKSVEQEAAKVHAPFAQQVADAKVPRDELAKKRQVAKDILKGKTLIRMPVRLEEAVRRNAARKLDATEDAFREAERNVADAAAKAAPYKGVHEGAANEVKNEVANQRLAQGAVKAGVIGIPTVGGIALAQHAINKSDEKAKKEARSKKKTASDLRYEDLMVRMKTAAWIGTAAKAAKGHRHFGGGTPAPEP